MNEKTPNQINSQEGDFGGNMFSSLMEKYPKVKKTALLLSVLAGTIGAPDNADAEQTKESQASGITLEASSQNAHEVNVANVLENMKGEEVKNALLHARTILNAPPDLPEDLQDYFYHSTDKTESVLHGGEAGTAVLTENIGELPLEGKNIMFGSFTKLGSLQVDRSEDITLWRGFSQHDVMAPADVVLEAGGTMSREGVGGSTSEALESALKSAVSFLGLGVSSATETTRHNMDSDSTSDIESNSVHYIKEYKVTSDVIVQSQWGEESVHKVTVELVVGVPDLK
ncbi:MAG: hypothetical protein ACI9VM_000201 [Candidatus Azotimanducaceae bacterium]|jgi:hypothetical protein